MPRDPAIHHAHQNHGAAEGVKPGIENQRLQRRFGRAGRRRNARHHGFQHRFHAQAALGADQQRVGSGNRQHVFNLLLRLFGLRGGQIDLVDDGNDREIVLRREKRVGDGLRFHALARVHDQQRAFARGQRAGNLVRKIDVARSVDQIELVFVAVLRGVVQANALGLDRDAALALEVHRVQDLRAHFALAERTGKFQQAVGQRGLAVVNVRDNAKIADETWVHRSACRRANGLRRNHVSCREHCIKMARVHVLACPAAFPIRSGTIQCATSGREQEALQQVGSVLISF